MGHKLFTSVLDIKIVDSVEDAPNYSGDEVTLLRADKAIVVTRGTEEGNPTVDIQMTDDEGNKFLIMATGGIIESLGKVVEATRVRTNTN